jgi:ABC-type protease/lipase transport system fused ATPase/permease subunit
MTGGVEIFAKTKKEAIAKFDREYDQCDLYEDASAAEITDIFEEDE